MQGKNGGYENHFNVTIDENWASQAQNVSACFVRFARLY